MFFEILKNNPHGFRFLTDETVKLWQRKLGGDGMRTLFCTFTAFVAAFASAFAATPCASSIKDWQPREALRAKLEAYGWNVQGIKTKNGCYQAHAFDATGAEITAYFDPKSFAAVNDRH
jgi:hypothetical protein